MDGTEYDVIIMGTGITESILSGLLSLEGKKILHIDRNPFYGDAGASLNITSLWKQFRPNEQPPIELGENRDWNIDLIPKFIMSYGKLVKMIMKTKVTEYLNWKPVEGIYVYQFEQEGFFSKGGGKIEKVPSNDKEALASSLMTFFEKRRCQKFFSFADKYDQTKPQTYQKHNPINKTFGEFIKQFDLEENTVDFLGHAVALETTDEFINKPAVLILEKIKMYMESSGRFNDLPFIYPVYGLAGIPESFSRKCAVYGGTFMLNVTLLGLQFDPINKVTTLQGSFEGEKGIAKSKIVIGNPSYFVALNEQKRLKQVGTILRCICIIDHQIQHTNKNKSLQIILPQKQTGRKSDIYIMMIGPDHGVCKKGYNLAIISTTAESQNPDDDLKLAYQIIGSIKYKFITKEVMYQPIQIDTNDGWFITNTLDPSSHFESAAENVIELYKAITGKTLDLTLSENKEN